MFAGVVPFLSTQLSETLRKGVALWPPWTETDQRARGPVLTDPLADGPQEPLHAPGRAGVSVVADAAGKHGAAPVSSPCSAVTWCTPLPCPTVPTCKAGAETPVRVVHRGFLRGRGWPSTCCKLNSTLPLLDPRQDPGSPG